MVRALVLRTAGTNCDEETVFALQLAGAKTELVHINQLRQSPKYLLSYQILALPGGFSYGDDISAGKVLALEILLFLREVIEEFIEKGNLIIGICNGFQVLVKTGLLPAIGKRFNVEVTLTDNDSGLFVDKWVQLDLIRRDLPWTKYVTHRRLFMPVAHAEGKFFSSEEILNRLEEQNLVVFKYAEGTNPNGSLRDIAGICDVTGQVLGLMPHPERAIVCSQYPDRSKEMEYNRTMPPLEIFRSAVKSLDKLY